MNIKIIHSWLKEYLESDASPEKLQKYISVCGPSIERIEKKGNDYIYDIEVTSNRIDTASVYGVAREAAAILPQYGIQARLKPLVISPPRKIDPELKFSITDDKKLTKRVVGIVMGDIKVAESPQYIKNRLEASGIRSLNNIIDITNYVMIELGHPTHVMDYDRIKTGKLIIRNAKKGESLITLDAKKYLLDDKDVIADDGTGRVVDLLGIMGCENSVVNDRTKRVVIFIESNDPQTIRRTSMKLGIRTVAATYDEKHVDSELTIIALYRVIELFEKLCKARPVTNPIDIYNSPVRKKTVSISIHDLNRIIGISIKKDVAVTILTNLGFELVGDEDNLLAFSIPSYRSHDVSIKEDLVEEVARIYGYQNIPGSLQLMAYVKQPKESELLFLGQPKIKYFLKHLGLHEVMNYSMISKDMIEAYDADPKQSLRLSNTISSEIEYMRRSLFPSLIKNCKDNEGKQDELRFFEIAKVYHPRKNDLPDEIYKLGIAVNTDFQDLKGIVDGLFREFNVELVVKKSLKGGLLGQHIQGELLIDDRCIGIVAELDKKYELRQQLSKPVYLAEIDLQTFIHSMKQFPKYRPLNPFATIKLDLTLELKSARTYQDIISMARKTSKFLDHIGVVSLYKNKVSLRFYFSSAEKNITEEEAKKQLEKIKKELY